MTFSSSPPPPPPKKKKIFLIFLLLFSWPAAENVGELTRNLTLKYYIEDENTLILAVAQAPNVFELEDCEAMEGCSIIS